MFRIPDRRLPELTEDNLRLLQSLLISSIEATVQDAVGHAVESIEATVQDAVGHAVEEAVQRLFPRRNSPPAQVSGIEHKPSMVAENKQSDHAEEAESLVASLTSTTGYSDDVFHADNSSEGGTDSSGIIRK